MAGGQRSTTIASAVADEVRCGFLDRSPRSFAPALSFLPLCPLTATSWHAHLLAYPLDPDGVTRGRSAFSFDAPTWAALGYGSRGRGGRGLGEFRTSGAVTHVFVLEKHGIRGVCCPVHVHDIGFWCCPDTASTAVVAAATASAPAAAAAVFVEKQFDEFVRQFVGEDWLVPWPVEIRKPLPTENLLEDTDGLPRPPFLKGGRSNPSVSSRCGSSASADVRTSGDVIAFEGRSQVQLSNYWIRSSENRAQNQRCNSATVPGKLQCKCTLLDRHLLGSFAVVFLPGWLPNVAFCRASFSGFSRSNVWYGWATHYAFIRNTHACTFSPHLTTQSQARIKSRL